MGSKRKSIIWNMTRHCLWNCLFCCVAAKKQNQFYPIEFDKSEKIDGELSYYEKIQVIDQLNPLEWRIDFSGGELFLDSNNLLVIEYAARKFGKENIGISTSGALLNERNVKRISECVSDVEITLDDIPFRFYPTRPIGYHEYAAHAVDLLVENGVRVGVQTVITSDNISAEKFNDMWSWLNKHKVDEWSLLRFFPAGRGISFNNKMPSHNEYSKYVEMVKKNIGKSNIDVKFQYLLPNHNNYTLKCRAVKHSIGILPDGVVVACFWALDNNMKSTDNKFILGKIPQDNINNVLQSENALFWLTHNHDCKIFSKNQLER